MGYIGALGMAQACDEDVALRWHLQQNHYPPINVVFVPVAKQVLELARQGAWQTTILMPNGKTLTVAQIIEGMHLEAFLNAEKEGERGE